MKDKSWVLAVNLLMVAIFLLQFYNDPDNDAQTFQQYVLAWIPLLLGLFNILIGLIVGMFKKRIGQYFTVVGGVFFLIGFSVCSYYQSN